MECRVRGSDINPYLAQAALLAAGIKGSEEGLDLSPPASGDVSDADAVTEVPTTLREAPASLPSSPTPRGAFRELVPERSARGAARNPAG